MEENPSRSLEDEVRNLATLAWRVNDETIRDELLARIGAVEKQVKPQGSQAAGEEPDLKKLIWDREMPYANTGKKGELQNTAGRKYIEEGYRYFRAERYAEATSYYVNAIEQFRKALAIDKDNTHIQLNIAYCHIAIAETYSRQKDAKNMKVYMDMADANLDQVRKKDPTSAHLKLVEDALFRVRTLRPR